MGMIRDLANVEVAEADLQDDLYGELRFVDGVRHLTPFAHAGILPVRAATPTSVAWIEGEPVRAVVIRRHVPSFVGVMLGAGAQCAVLVSCAAFGRWHIGVALISAGAALALAVTALPLLFRSWPNASRHVRLGRSALGLPLDPALVLKRADLSRVLERVRDRQLRDGASADGNPALLSWAIARSAGQAAEVEASAVIAAGPLPRHEEVFDPSERDELLAVLQPIELPAVGRQQISREARTARGVGAVVAVATAGAILAGSMRTDVLAFMLGIGLFMLAFGAPRQPGGSVPSWFTLGALLTGGALGLASEALHH